MSETNKKIDTEVRKERQRNIIVGLALVPLVILIVWFMAPTAGEIEDVYGTPTRVTALPSEYGNLLYMLVTLESGEEIRARIENSGQFRKNHRVRLIKQMPIIIGKPVYRFRGYVNDDA